MTTSPYIRVARRIGALFCLAAFPALGAAVGCSSPDAANTGSSAQAVGSVGLVISAVYGGGGNSGALFNSDFVELFNRGTSSISLQGMSLQYGSPTGDFQVVATLPNVTIAPGRYFLVGANPPDSGTPLPTPDFVAAGLALGATNGKVALASVATPLGCGAVRCATSNVVDMVGYGTANDFEGPAGSAIAALSATLGGARKGAGCTDSDVNKDDFDVATVTAPRNQATTAATCGANTDGGLDAADDGSANTDGGTDASDDGATSDGATSDGAADDGAASDGATNDSATNDGATNDGATDGGTDASPTDSGPVEAGPPGDGTGLVISAVYGGGGNNGAVVNHDFVELFNRTRNDVSTKGLSLQYASAARDFGSPTADGGPSVDILALPDMVIPAGAYFLVSLASSNVDAGAPLPTPDLTGNLALAATNGKVALAKVTTGLGCGATHCNTPNVVDLVGYGTASDFEGAAAVPVLSNTTGAARKGAGCTDTNDNKADFDVGAPAPRNAAAPHLKCGTTPVPDGGPGPGPGPGPDDSGTSPPPFYTDSGSHGGGVDAASPPMDDFGSGDTGGCNTTGGRGESPLAFVLALVGVALARRRRAA